MNEDKLKNVLNFNQNGGSNSTMIVNASLDSNSTMIVSASLDIEKN